MTIARRSDRRAPASRPPASRPGASRGLGLSLAVRESLAGWLFAAPWVLGFLAFTAGPIAISVYIPFTKWSVLGTPQWVGLDNYQRMFADPLFYNAIGLTTVYAVISVPLQTLLALGLALLLNNSVRGIGVYRTLFYLPAILPIASVAVIFRWAFEPSWGIVNYLLSLLRLPQPQWLSSPDGALPALILMSLWNVGIGMVIFLAGLQGVPEELHEAARIDGAGWLQRLRHVTLPALSPVVLFQVLTTAILAMQVFVQPYLMTQGGPGDRTRFLLLYVYQNAFQFFDMGYAATLSIALFVYIVVLTALTLVVSRRYVHDAVGQRG